MDNAMTPREQVRLDLATEVLRRFGQVRFVAHGSSMIPSIYPGDLLIARSTAIADVCPGQIILCSREGRFWTHRVTRKWREGERYIFATRGDALADEDPYLEEGQMLGRVTSIVRYGKPVQLPRINSFWTKLLRCGVRNSTSLTKALLRRHSLRMRLLGPSHELLTDPGTPFLECM